MTNSALSASTSPSTGIDPRERRSAGLSWFVCDLWMVDHQGSTVLRCRCLESSPVRMRLHVPSGYGVVEGQRYELYSLPPGERSPALSGSGERRWATVVQVGSGDGEDVLEVTLLPDQCRLAEMPLPDQAAH